MLVVRRLLRIICLPEEADVLVDYIEKCLGLCYIFLIVLRRFRIQGTALTYGIASRFLARQPFKAKTINRMTSLLLTAFFSLLVTAVVCMK